MTTGPFFEEEKARASILRAMKGYMVPFEIVDSLAGALTQEKQRAEQAEREVQELTAKCLSLAHSRLEAVHRAEQSEHTAGEMRIAYDAMEAEREQAEARVRTLERELVLARHDAGCIVDDGATCVEPANVCSVHYACVTQRAEQAEALAETLVKALDEAHAIMGSEEMAGAETIARVHGMRYTEAFQARCRVAHAARTAALARYHAGP